MQNKRMYIFSVIFNFNTVNCVLLWNCWLAIVFLFLYDMEQKTA